MPRYLNSSISAKAHLHESKWGFQSGCPKTFQLVHKMPECWRELVVLQPKWKDKRFGTFQKQFLWQDSLSRPGVRFSPWAHSHLHVDGSSRSSIGLGCKAGMYCRMPATFLCWLLEDTALNQISDSGGGKPWPEAFWAFLSLFTAEVRKWSRHPAGQNKPPLFAWPPHNTHRSRWLQ